MLVNDVTAFIEKLAPLAYQESYDNSGLLVGNRHGVATGVLITIDVTPQVVEEAIAKGTNLIVSHHPLIFNGLKRITGNSYVEASLLLAIKNDIAIYAAHTNLDSVLTGVNGKIAEKLGLTELSVLQPVSHELVKLVTFAPSGHADRVRQALFDAGAGHIGNYDCCSFNTDGTGTFRAGEKAKPFVGGSGQLHSEPETRIEVILPKLDLPRVIAALQATHPYEEVAYDIYPLLNSSGSVGMGMVGSLDKPVGDLDFLKHLKRVFNARMIRHTQLKRSQIRRVAFCGGSGSHLLKAAISSGADIFISADFKYHQFFDHEELIIIADIGHFESEQFTVELIYDHLIKKFSKFAVFKSETKTNPINYL